MRPFAARELGLAAGWIRVPLRHLESFPFVRAARVRGELLELHTREGHQQLRLVEMQGGLSYARVNAVIAARLDGEPWILLAPYVPPGIGEQIARHEGNYIDAVGNAHLSLGGRYFVHVEGKRPPSRAQAPKPLRSPGLQALLALLSEPELARAPVRDIAARAGVSKSTISNLLRQLKADRRLVVGDDGVHHDESLWDTFAVGYAETLRPKWLVGRYQAKERDLAAVELHIAGTLHTSTLWGFGGGAAADRLTGHYHGPDVVLHLTDIPADFAQRLRLLPAENGPIVVIHTPCPAAFMAPTPEVVAPVLVYAELLATGTDRELEAAALVRQGHPPKN